ncbi:hypothetical protein JXA12_01145 [Candidatus Woesearchaeota archaeon]|nr:hypothetical protein [Candidatus Woesearchaeota archaeon]
MARHTSPSLRLVEHGFIKSGARSLYKQDEATGKFVIIDAEKHGKPAESHADEEEAEEANISAMGAGDFTALIKTGYPAPVKRYRLVYESFNMSLEELYFWFLNHLRQDQGYPRVEKITDIFSASENSAFFGQSAQRLSIQEDRASSFLKGIAELVKQLFQIVRELRIIDERLVPYHDWEVKGEDGKTHHSKAADSTLKGVFADFAENKGGQMQPGSIYHLAQTVGYASLPDLFFNTHVYKKDDVDKVVDGMKQFNANVRNVLKRKIYQFLVWREKTYDELQSRRRFQIKYLRQHWATIKMYMSWTKPYLKHIKRLHMNERQMDSPDLISAFETSMTEIEILCVRPSKTSYHPCVLATFEFSTRPLMQYRQEYQQGPVHVGKGTATLRAYAWTEEQIARYKKLKEDEDRELLYLVDDSVAAAMEELGDDLEKYLNEHGKDVFDRDVHAKFGSSEEPQKKGKLKAAPSAPVWEPFVAVFSGLWDAFNAVIPVGGLARKKPSGPSGKPSGAAKIAAGTMWQAFKNYKKAHGLLSW